jgi:hypothetical protein
MLRLLTAALLSFAVFWLVVLGLQALGGAAIYEVLFALAVAIMVGVLVYRRVGRSNAAKSRAAQP